MRALYVLNMLQQLLSQQKFEKFMEERKFHTAFLISQKTFVKLFLSLFDLKCISVDLMFHICMSLIWAFAV